MLSFVSTTRRRILLSFTIIALGLAAFGVRYWNKTWDRRATAAATQAASDRFQRQLHAINNRNNKRPAPQQVER